MRMNENGVEGDSGKDRKWIDPHVNTSGLTTFSFPCSDDDGGGGGTRQVEKQIAHWIDCSMSAEE